MGGSAVRVGMMMDDWPGRQSQPGPKQKRLDT
jgi:hypothetical protein